MTRLELETDPLFDKLLLKLPAVQNEDEFLRALKGAGRVYWRRRFLKRFFQIVRQHA